MHYQTNFNQINLHCQAYVTQIVTLLLWGNLHLNWTTSFHVHKGGWAAKANVTLWGKNGTCMCTHRHQRSNPNISVTNVTVGVAVGDASSGRYDTKLSVPLLTALQARSQQQVRHLTGAKSVDSESKWQTDHTLHQQQSQTTARQSSAPTPSVSLRCHHPALCSSPHLNSPLALRCSHLSLPTQAHHKAEGGARRTVLYNKLFKCSWRFKQWGTRGNVLLIAHDQCLLFLLHLKSSVRYPRKVGD